MPTLDSHHHFWRFNEADYGWIQPSQTALRRDFLPADLEREIGAAGIEGVISVQARQTLEETRWLLDLAREHAFIRGVVGWVPLVAPDVGETLATLAASEPKLRSVRHVLQGEPDGYMLGEAFNQGLARLAPLNLVYDLLVFERQLPEAITLVDRHPSQRFVLDHIAKPRIAAGELEPWARNIRDLARRPNVYCKLSGMVTEADRTSWSDSQLRPYFDHVVSCFGPSRLMFGSDWPVCLDVCDYARWRQMVGRWTNLLTADEQARIFGETAVEAYRL